MMGLSWRELEKMAYLRKALLRKHKMKINFSTQNTHHFVGIFLSFFGL